MQIYFFDAGINSDELVELETRIRSTVPDLKKIDDFEELTKNLGGAPSFENRICIVFPVLTASVNRLIQITSQYAQYLFFIFVSDEISASDYKRLLRSGADWVSRSGAPQDILDIVARRKTEIATAAGEGSRPVITAFVPSAGGVGTATISIETAIQLKIKKGTRNKRICLLDCDFQTSHVCDYLDIEPRLQIEEISANPERLDAQLFELFVSHHSTGLDILAAPRSKERTWDVSMRGFDALFDMIAARYDLLLMDLPLPWFSWSGQIVSAADLAVVCGENTVPGLRQVAETLASLRSLEQGPRDAVVVLNRCERRPFGGIARK